MDLTLPDLEVPDPDATWAASGAMALTGRGDGPPLLAPPSAVTGLLRLAGALRELTPVSVDGPALLGERAATAGFERHGDVSCGGATRLRPVADGWLAVTLARPEDVDAVAAWLGTELVPGELAERLRSSPADHLVERAALLGLPVARLGEAAPPSLVNLAVPGEAPPRPSLEGTVVIDLSSLWAGPLCAHLLQLAGARVIKVESETRPDGARNGPPAFFDLLHAGQESVVLDFRAECGRAALRRLVASGDVVIEASRPRALAQLGAGPEQVLAEGRPQVWVSITGHGRSGPSARRVAFGDDAAVAGGLVVWDGSGPCFCADAVADPAAGLLAAAAVAAGLRAGGRWLLDVTLSGTAAFLAGGGGRFDGRTDRPLPVAPPRARPPAGAAPAFGAHTEAVLRELGSR
jgi:crotonobetainyl-CoA:carnitine CoA-transferase CaiB-like acyl-CoA transferase